MFHRVDDPMRLGSARYFLLAERLHHYAGAVRGALVEDQQSADPVVSYAAAATPPATMPPVTSAAPGEEVRYIDVEDVDTLVRLSNQGGFAGFEYVGGVSS